MRFLPAIGLAAVLLLGTGCNLALELAFNADGSGQARTVLSMTGEEVRFSSLGGNHDGLCAQMSSDKDALGPNASMVQRSNGEGIDCVTSVDFRDWSELDLSNDLAITMAGVNGVGRFVFEADVKGSGAEGDSELGGLFQGLIDGLFLRITAPGAIDQARSNADSYDGNTATWRLSSGDLRHVILESSSS